ncbi:MAG TPA: serine/threonine-protein kinase, partial [Blastocatellia bacterium]|nr:serine/threonine-protein kinase [Blastocatellia bacterium]
MLDQLQPGTLIADRFRIDRLLNRGGMGAVYQANQIGLERPVALKLLLPTFSEDAKMRERFHREARSAALLSHPNIIQIYDYGVSDWGPYIVMELVRGESLRHLIARGALAPEMALKLISQVCAAVATAHDAGIIHRDLKPDNILIEERADGYFVKVLDFGIAKLRDVRESTTDTADLTGANVIGSPNYMSPEQCMGLELDARADIYSLGIVLYEMLTGRVPFSDPSAVKVLMQQVNEMPRRLTELRPDLTGAIEAVVLRALAKERLQRYESALQLSAEFKLALEKPATFDTYITSVSPEVVQPTPVAIQNAGATNVMPTLLVDQHSDAKPQLATVHSSPSCSSNRRLAILPLRNLTGDADIEYLGFALADSVITQLCCVKCLIIRPSSAIER